jgi:nucleotide-binding universal stress UspA family protein
VVRGPAGLPAKRPSVVVGVDGTDDSDPALEFGFDHASRHGLPLEAVLCWRRDLNASMQRQSEQPVPADVEQRLSSVVSRWRDKYPDVRAHDVVVRDHPVTGLVTASAAQHLLVVGSRRRHALAGTLLGSVSQAVLHEATCPVAVIPVAAS